MLNRLAYKVAQCGVPPSGEDMGRGIDETLGEFEERSGNCEDERPSSSCYYVVVSWIDLSQISIYFLDFSPEILRKPL